MVNAFKNAAAVLIGVVAIAGFGVLVIFLLRHLGDAEPAWSRLVFVFGAVEALALAGAGFIFGREVHRERAERAEARADGAERAEQKFADLVHFIRVKNAWSLEAGGFEVVGALGLTDPVEGAGRAGSRAERDWVELAAFVTTMTEPVPEPGRGSPGPEMEPGRRVRNG